MRISTEEKKAEAVKRMKMLNLDEAEIEWFKNKGTPMEVDPLIGLSMTVLGDELERVRKFEKENNALVYYVVNSYIPGEAPCQDYLYVSDRKEEWPSNRAYIKKGFLPTYAVEKKAPYKSGFSMIQYRK